MFGGAVRAWAYHDGVGNAEIEAGAARIAEAIGKHGKVVFFGGAGVSTESGIPDFRSEKGLYHAQQDYGRSPEELLSYSTFADDPELFFRYYVENLIDLTAKPNPAHLAVAELEKRGFLTAVVTQNIDGLHQMAGSQNVIELHGSNWRPYCTQCGKKYSLEWLLDRNNWRVATKPLPDAAAIPAETNDEWLDNLLATEGKLAPDAAVKFPRDAVVPRCDDDDAIVRPDVVLYGESLSATSMNAAARAINDAEVLIVAGTSLAVYPAAGLVRVFRGDSLVVINLSPTDLDAHADILVTQPVGQVMAAAIQDLD